MFTFKGNKMKRCECCNNKGFIFSNNEAWEDEIQKCDVCNVFKTDQEAQNEYLNWMMEECNLQLQWENQ